MIARHHTPAAPAIAVLILSLISLTMTGCGWKYVSPGRAADMSIFARTTDTNPTVAAAWDRRPGAPFPAKLAVVRIQGPGYHSYTANSWGRGNYSIVTTRDVEPDDTVLRLAALPFIHDVVTLNRLIVPHELNTDLDLRQAAGAVQADLILLYTFDTAFHVEGTFEPIAIVTLGLFPNKSAKVTSTASAALIDTRTGYVYYLGEQTEKTSQLANAWTSDEAVDQSRKRAERNAFENLLAEFEDGWGRITDRFAHANHPHPAISRSSQPANPIYRTR